MIHTSTQLKALVRNMSKGNSMQAQIIIRNYMMERFLERLSQSKYRDNFILKGGTLVSAMVGLDTRSTLDIDTTIRGFSLTVDEVADIVGEIISIHLEDEVEFQITRIYDLYILVDFDDFHAAHRRIVKCQRLCIIGIYHHRLAAGGFVDGIA